MSLSDKIVFTLGFGILAALCVAFGAICLPETGYKFSWASIRVFLSGFGVASLVTLGVLVTILILAFTGYALRCWLDGGTGT